MIRVPPILALLPIVAFAAAQVSNAKRDAQRLVACMTSLDADCAASVTYTKFLEDMGAPREELIKPVRELYRNLQALGARYVVELENPWEEFSGDGRKYVF